MTVYRPGSISRGKWDAAALRLARPAKRFGNDGIHIRSVGFGPAGGVFAEHGDRKLCASLAVSSKQSARIGERGLHGPGGENPRRGQAVLCRHPDHAVDSAGALLWGG